MTQKSSVVASVTDAESEILKQLWDESPLPAQAIIDRLQEESPAHPKTVRTLINRLLKKGALAYKEKQRTYYYYPTFSREDFHQIKMESVLDKVFDGELSPMLSFFTSRKRLNEKEIAQLKKLIADVEGDSDDE